MAQQRPGTSPGGARRGSTGTIVGGRYRLVRPLVPDVPGAEPWSATDTILDRPVRVDLITGPRTAAALDAARRAALVTEPRLARILQVTQDGDLGIIVTGEVEGRSLADLAAAGPLPPDQARAVVGEVAGALEEARRRGLHHLALRPRAIVITPAGRVTLRGLAVEGALLGLADTRAHAASRRDAIDLIRVLYAALTGRWPAPPTTTGALPTFAEWQTPGADDPLTEPDPGLPAAPTLGTASAPPTEVVPGVPADLDTLCAVTLGPHEDGPHSPGEVVRELEPWRPVHAQELFHAADAGRWPSVNGASGGPSRSVTGGAGPAGAGAAPASTVGAIGAGAGAVGAGAAGAAAVGAGAVGAGAGAGAAGAGASGVAAVHPTEAPPRGASARPTTGKPDRPRSESAAAETAPATDSPSTARETAAPRGGTPSVLADSPGTAEGATTPTAPPGWSWPIADAAPSAASGGAPTTTPSAAPSWPSLRATTGPTDGPTTTPRPARDATGDPDDASADAGAAPTETATLPTASATEPTSTERTPAEPNPAERTPAKQTPADPAPAEQTPAEQTPADPAPAERTPDEPTPVEQTPAEQTPADPASPEPAPAQRDATDPAPATADAPAAPPTTPTASVAPPESATAAGPTAPASAPPTGSSAMTDQQKPTPDDGSDAAPATPAGSTPARQSVRASFASGEGAGTRRPGTPPPAIPPRTPARQSSTSGTAATGSAATAAGTPAASGTSTPASQSPQTTSGASGGPGSGTGSSGTPEWGLPFDPESRPARQPRNQFDPTRWVLGLVGVGIVVVLVIAIGHVTRPWGQGDDDTAAAPAATTQTTAAPTEAPAAPAEEAPAPAVAPVIAGVTTIDPSDADGEKEELIPRIWDGDPNTAWYTHTYNRPDFAGFKDAVGIAITLTEPATVSTVTLQVNGSGGNVEVRATDAANPTAGDVLASGPLNGTTVLTLSQPTETQNIVLWFTSLAQTPDGKNRIEISELTVG